MKDRIKQLNEKSKDLTAQEIIQLVNQEFRGRATFASSLGEEDQVITDMISKIAPEISIFTLDTGRLFQETYDLLAKTQKRYSNLDFKIYYPNTQKLEEMVQEKGVNLFYESVENRKLCCGIRKIEPLKRALNNADVWLSGLRRAQSITRTTAEVFEYDEGNEKIKVSPLVHWSLEQVHAYVEEHNIDVNPLHAQGFVSIGCAPCTRAIKKGEDIRAGRWWWETPESKECGLHNNPNRPKK